MWTINEANHELKGLSPRIVGMAWDTVRLEGGIEDDPADPGGITNHGISLRYAQGHGTLFDLNHDERVDGEDIRLITPELAVTCFLMDFFLAPGFQRLPEALQSPALDFAVNSGAGTAAKALQRTLNHLRLRKPDLAARVRSLADDGIIGPLSASAAQACLAALGEASVVDAYVDCREAYDRADVSEHPNMGEFLKGWIARCESFREPLHEQAQASGGASLPAA